MTLTFDGAPAPNNDMPADEVLARASAFDPTPISHDCGCEYCKGLPHWTGKPNREAIMRLALEMIASHSGQTGDTRARLARVRRIAEQALRECGK